MSFSRFFDLPDAEADAADVLLLPLPYEGTVSYGRGTARGPEAIWRASGEVELWDEELDFALEGLGFHTAEPLVAGDSERPESYLERVFQAAGRLHEHAGLVIGVGGEHSVTPALVSAAAADAANLSELTVVQIDAHADLREEYDGTKHSHACAMRRLVEKGAQIVAIGIRSVEREEFEFGATSGQVRTFFAQQLAEETDAELKLLHLLGDLRGEVYLTIDIDGLEVLLCPGTGTPQPGGLGWWQALRYLRELLYHNPYRRLAGCDVVETAPMPETRVNEFTAARLVGKVIAYHFARRG